MGIDWKKNIGQTQSSRQYSYNKQGTADDNQNLKPINFTQYIIYLFVYLFIFIQTVV